VWEGRRKMVNLGTGKLEWAIAKLQVAGKETLDTVIFLHISP